jgi:hypothetical protein
MIRFLEWTNRSHRANAVMKQTNDLATFPSGFVISQGHNVQNQVKLEKDHKSQLRMNS